MVYCQVSMCGVNRCLLTSPPEKLAQHHGRKKIPKDVKMNYDRLQIWTVKMCRTIKMLNKAKTMDDVKVRQLRFVLL